MESAINTIEALIQESENLKQISETKSASSVVSSTGRRADYSSLCERVNLLGTTLAEIKEEFQNLNNEKKQIVNVIEKIENLDSNEVKKLSSMINSF